MKRLLLLLPLVACVPERAPIQTSDGVIRTALVDDARWNRVNALDVFVFDAGALGCAALLQSRLEDPSLRDRTSEHARVCEVESMRQVMGRVTPGKRAVLVVASQLPSTCSDTGNDEVIVPGQVLAAGCDELDVEAGRNHRVDITLFPHRDPAGN